ncbi:PAS domain-containing protein [Horticoccus sp. 23ND18S-11]|uniref:PAS domain-containing protein n=1 Tax=Horticoccus sp. 23ND18S-11 TaxID=3391832 RepID=UPI0039C99BE4
MSNRSNIFLFLVLAGIAVAGSTGLAWSAQLGGDPQPAFLKPVLLAGGGIALVALALAGFFLRREHRGDIASATPGSAAALKTSDQEIRDRAELLSSINSNLSGTCVYRMVYHVDGRMECPYISPNIEELIGIPADAFRANPPQIFDFIHPADLPGFQQTIRDALASGKIASMTTRIRNAHGGYIWTHFSSRLLERRPDGAQVRDGIAVDVTHLKAVEAELRTVRQRLELALRASNACTWDAEIAANRVTLDPMWQEMRGFLPRPTVTTWRRLISSANPEDRADISREVRRAVYGETDEYRVVQRMATASGGWNWIMSHGRVTERDPAGRALRMIGTNTDITARKAAEDDVRRLNATLERLVIDRTAALAASTVQLAKSEHLFRNLVENIDQCYFVTNRQHQFTYCNPAVAAMIGVPERELIGTSLLRIITDEDRPRVMTECENLIRDGVAAATLEFRIKAREGRVLWVELAKNLVRNSSGEVTEFRHVMRDVSARKAAETLLRQSEGRLAHALDATRDGVWDWNMKTGHVYFSPQWERLLGYAPGEVPQTVEFFYTVLHPDDVPRVKHVLAEHFAGRILIKQHEVRLRLKTGEYRWFYDRGKVVERDEANEPARMVGTITDITEKRKADLRVTTYARLAHELSNSNSIESAGRKITQAADELIGWDSAELVILDEKTHTCRPVVNIDLVDGVKREVPSARDGLEPSPRMRKTIVEGAELILRRHPADRVEGMALFNTTTRRSASLMFVPIRDGHTTVGTLAIHSYQADAYQPADLETLQSLADYCGGALSRIFSREALDASESRLREAQAISHIGNFNWDARTDVVRWSDELYRIYGRPLTGFDPSVGEYIDAVHPDDRARVIATLEDAKTRLADYDHDYRIVLPDGQVRWVYARGHPVVGEGGRLIGLEGTCQDITERKRAEELLRLSEEQQELALAGAGLGLWDWDVQSGKAVFDARWCGMIGYAIDELRPDASTWYSLMHPEDLPGVRAVLEPHLRGETVNYETEFRLRHKNGHWLWILARGKVVERDASGTARRMAGTHMDLTERKESQEALQSLLKEKEALLKEVHHRVKNNLQVITSLLRLEAARGAQSDTKATLMAMQGRIRSMALLHESLYRSGMFAAVDLGAYLRQIATQSFRSLVPTPSPIRLELDLVAVHVGMDHAIPCGLLVNELIANCLKHGFPDQRAGEVRVELHRCEGDGMLRLRVSDTGAGLPADFAERRGDSLGLQLVSDLALQLQGTLEIGAGPVATFTITFSPDSL